MCAMLMGLPAGIPVMLTTNVTDTGPVKLPEASRGPSNVIVASPLPPDSSFEIGGTSFAAEREAVNVGFEGVVDGDVDDFEQPEATNARATTNRDKRFISFSLEELAREVESQVQMTWSATAGE